VHDVFDAAGIAALATGTEVIEATSTTDVGASATLVANVEDDTSAEETTPGEAVELGAEDTGAASFTGPPSKISF
jgi:hypothetical protein